MKNLYANQLYRVMLALSVFLICMAGAISFFYLQTDYWVKNQQLENMSRAQQQLDSLLARVNQSVQTMRGLIGEPCTAQTVAELRRQLAITPNVGNIELAKSGEVYCSSLLGEVRTGAELREESSLYMTDKIPSLPGHPFIVFHLHENGYGLYTSTDGFYIRNILESASEISSVVLMTERGWMTQDGVIHRSAYATNGSYQVHSEAYGYRLSSNINSSDIIAICLKRGHLMIAIFVVLSSAIAFASYMWSGRPRTLEKMLILAMKNHELHPYYQPIVKGDPAEPVGCEVLVRWQHKGSIIPPDQFIPLAEQTGLIVPVTRQLIRDVTDQFAIFYKPKRQFYISFNISARHLQSEMLEVDLDYFLSRVDDNISLVLELTEREIIAGDERVKHNISRLKARGVRFALDDFGTGYSTLETLQYTTVDMIKVDRLFTAGIGSNDLCQSIIENIIDLAKRVDADIIVEGVETEVQAAFLRQQGEMALQGYLFSKPLPVEAFKIWLGASDANSAHFSHKNESDAELNV
ncbi:EAL domain-containing protein [Enterobacter asburiae]